MALFSLNGVAEVVHEKNRLFTRIMLIILKKNTARFHGLE